MGKRWKQFENYGFDIYYQEEHMLTLVMKIGDDVTIMIQNESKAKVSIDAPQNLNIKKQVSKNTFREPRRKGGMMSSKEGGNIIIVNNQKVIVWRWWV